MRPASKVVLVGAVLGAIGGAVVGAGRFAGAQSQGGSQAPLSAVSASITDSVRLDVSATTPAGTTLGVSGVDGARLTVEALGPAGGPVNVSGVSGGPVVTSLTASSLNSLLHPTCVQGRPEINQVGITPIQLPRGPGHADPATAWTAVNLSGNRRLCCLPSLDGGVPTIDCDPPTDGGIGLGYVVGPGFGQLDITGEDLTHTVYCRADGTMAAHTVNVNVWEDSCIQ